MASLNGRVARLEAAVQPEPDGLPPPEPMDWPRWQRLLAELLATLSERHVERLTATAQGADDPPIAHLLALCTDLVDAVYRNPSFARLVLSSEVADLLLARPDSHLWPCNGCRLPLPYGKGPYRTAGGSLLEATVHLLPRCPACGGSPHGVSPMDPTW